MAFDAVGAALWSGAYVGLGYVFSKDLDRAVAYAARMGRLLAIVVLAGLTIYVGRKLVRWHRLCANFD
jgi:membrane protein DedA with SNARE-associated domain